MDPFLTVRMITQLIERATSYESIFGPLPAGHDERKRALTMAFRALALEVHPDRTPSFPDATRIEAEETFKRLVALSREAEQPLFKGTYSEPRRLPPFEVHRP